MLNSTWFRFFLALSTAAGLSACTGSGRIAPQGPGDSTQSTVRQTSGTASPMRSSKPTGIVYAADQGGFHKPSGFCAYANTGSNQSPAWCQTGSPLKFPSGMWVDASANLYVADFSGSVFEYNTPTLAGAPGNPSFAYSDALAGQTAFEPVDVVVCGDYLYAANLINLSGSQLEFGFTVWQLGNSVPLEVLHSRYDDLADNGGYGFGIGCDSKGNLLFAYTDSYLGGGNIDEWTQQNGSTPPTFVKTLPSACSYFQGLAIGKRDILLTADPFYSRSCKPRTSEYPALVELKETKANPLHACGPTIKPAFSDPYSEAWELNDKHAWAADIGNNTLYQVAMGKCLTTNTITIGLNGSQFSALDGVAVYPPEIP